jgi:hypothetical protein
MAKVTLTVTLDIPDLGDGVPAKMVLNRVANLNLLAYSDDSQTERLDLQVTEVVDSWGEIIYTEEEVQ